MIGVLYIVITGGEWVPKNRKQGGDSTRLTFMSGD